MDKVASFNPMMSPGTKEAVVQYPWAPTMLPPLKAGERGRYRVTDVPPGRSQAYYVPFDRSLGSYRIGKKSFGRYHKKDEVDPYRQYERHVLMPHLHYAKGVVVVSGAEYGMFIYNVLQKSDVTKVIVMEPDLDVVYRLHALFGIGTMRQVHKLSIFEGKAHQAVHETGLRPDYAFFHKFDRAACLKLNPKQVSWIGQDADFIEWCNGQGEAAVTVEACQKQWCDFVAQSGLPMIGTDEPRFGSLATAAMTFDAAGKIRSTNPAASGTMLQLGLKLLGVYR